MSDNLKTIRELAEELGVSKQAIQYHGLKSIFVLLRVCHETVV